MTSVEIKKILESPEEFIGQLQEKDWEQLLGQYPFIDRLWASAVQQESKLKSNNLTMAGIRMHNPLLLLEHIQSHRPIKQSYSDKKESTKETSQENATELFSKPMVKKKRTREELQQEIDAALKGIKNKNDDKEMSQLIKSQLKIEVKDIAKSEVLKDLNTLHRDPIAPIESESLAALKEKVDAYKAKKGVSTEERLTSNVVESSKPLAFGREEDMSEIQKFVDKNQISDVSVHDKTEAADEVLNESIAEMYVKQGEIIKAVDVYKKMGLKYPEKMSYFAAKIIDLYK